MPYGTIKVDTVTFTDGGVDKSVTVSGLVQNPTFSGNVTATGTISGATVRATTVSGTTVTGTTANFASGVFTTQISGAIVKAPDGSAAVPSLQVGTGATVSPGLYGAGTDILGFSTGGAGRLFIDSTGRVGIGTSSPASPLDVFGGGIRSTDSAGNARSKFEVFTNGQTTSQVTLGQGFSAPTDNIGYLYNRANAAFVFGTNDTERLRIDSSGRLLVGTSTAPTGSVTQYAKFFLAGNTGDATASSVLALGKGSAASNGDTLGQIYFTDSTNGQYAFIGAYADAATGSGDNPGRLVFSTTADGASSPTERLRIDSSGNVGIGTSSPGTALEVNGAAKANYSVATGGLAAFASSSGGLYTYFTSGAGVIQSSADNSGTAAPLIFNTGSERARIDSSGRLLVGTSSARTNFASNTSTPLIQTEGTTAGTSSASIVNNSDGVVGSTFNLSKTRATSVGGNTVVVSGDEIGIINFQAADGTNLLAAASIQAAVDGTPGANDMPGRLVFSTTADGASSPTERMRISNAGRITVANSSLGTVSALGSVSGTVTLDLVTANNFSATLPAGGTVTLANPSNQSAGQSGAIVITQNGTTAATVAYGSNWKFSGGTPTMSTGLGSVSVLVYYVESASRITARLITDVQ